MTVTDATAPGAGTERSAARTAEAPAPLREGQTVHLGHGELLHAIQQNFRENTVTLDMAGMKIRLPALDSLAWLGGLATLAALGILEWPVAAAVGVGHVLAHQRHIRLLEEFGEALQKG